MSFVFIVFRFCGILMCSEEALENSPAISVLANHASSVPWRYLALISYAGTMKKQKYICAGHQTHLSLQTSIIYF